MRELTRRLIWRLFHRLGWVTSPTHRDLGKKCCNPGLTENYNWAKEFQRGLDRGLEQARRALGED